MQGWESRLFGRALCGSMEAPGILLSGGVPGCSRPERPLSCGASEMLSPTGEGRQGVGASFSPAGGKEETLIWATSS